MKRTEFLRSLWYKLSANQRFIIRRIYYLPIDLYDFITKRRHKYVPPRGYIFTGSPASANNYLEQGIKQLNLLKKHTFLNPSDYVLDVGCGIGRTAIALTNYLDETGRYEGFDAVGKGVEWCNRKIKRDFTNFNFTFVPIYNDLYNNSEIKANTYVFPYSDNLFDKVFLFSVFTHMQIDEIQHYLLEIERVLKPSGICLATLFTYNDENEDFIANRKDFGFPFLMDNYRLMNDKVRYSNIAISEKKLDEIITNTNLRKIDFVEGFWKGKADKKEVDFQDILILKKN
jgi:ubiquinone/menaquinone biosynthesis C-methylase UbiE